MNTFRLPAWIERETGRKRRWALAIAVAAVISLLVYRGTRTGRPDFPARRGSFHPDKRFDVQGVHAAVASDSELCSQMGVDILKAGGNAADAAVTVALCIGSVDFHLAGIGGGGFITVRDANGTAKTIDCRETAPAAAHKHMFDDDRTGATFGGRASGVPGELAGIQRLYDLFGSGKLSWADLVRPVIKLNRRGFYVSPSANLVMVSLIEPYGLSHFFEHPGWNWLFPDGVNIGDSGVQNKVFRPQYANTLEKVAEGGAWAFYDPEGEIAPHLVEINREFEGILTLEDMANYEAVVREPLTTEFRGGHLITGPAPTSGPALILGLNVMGELIRANSTDLSPVDTQRLIESMKWMAAARSELGDPAFVDNARMAEILTSEWADAVRGNISDQHTLPSWQDYDPSYEMNDPKGTTHFSIIDANGVAVSMTSTVNTPFGSLVADPVTGVILNSEMDDFSLPGEGNFFDLAPSIYNFIEPGKRPLSSAAPSIFVRDGEVEVVIGAAGGSRIVTCVFQALVRILGYDLPVLDAVALPRLHHQLLPNEVQAEMDIPASVLESLAQKGHAINGHLFAASSMTAVRRWNGTLHAVSDYWRKSSIAAAY